MENNQNKTGLTSAEMGKLWATYVGNTMGKCVLSYYLKHIDDRDIKKVLKDALSLSEGWIRNIKSIFEKEKFPIPVGFSEEDVNLDVPRLFHDEFYLHYLQYLGKAGMSIYSVAIPLVSRIDIRNLYIKGLNDTSKLLGEVNDILKEKGHLANSPYIPNPKGTDFIDKQNYLNGFVGNKRPLHGLEIAHLYGNLNNDVTSKALIIGFSQGTRNEKVRKYLERGKDINHKHIEGLSKKLSEDHLPSPTLLDHLVTTSTSAPFSDKLMVFHKIDMFSMKIREYANGASLNGRKDIGVLYARCLLDVSLYVEDGANLMIDHNWLEQPPGAPNRNQLIKEK
ncbi:DUF3231 family protein [Lederbergia wuyishanensis]|uniref:Spore coat protein CotF n=1 Tax=Lederbergia wuyishanensis TaxID=1347903 RepID=A0ABU0D5M6_9BACI|nr:DUF3231 family protein [Lederbergia wuyishanensis]MCJ8008300.1 DUF3231 family protein [Lederbergia wuyishanensis]MDQ0343712.1 spore coat protein CotF [Lederbergia wuyishanensis]